MAQMNPDELEEFQKLSDQYQANLPGPLIGDNLPMDVLVTEYAQADPTFVVKTTGLAATHSAYRAVKGDGQCGWRATVFSYFEILLRSGDSGFVQGEKIRFESFKDMMEMIGIAYDLMVDMFDYTFELFDKVRQAVERGDQADKVILDYLNDENISNSIVYHFKMITSAHMELRAEQYEPFLEMTVGEYRAHRIDPTHQEIDQIGLQALTDAIITPAGFALEVLYLDRSMGEEVTPHAFSQASADAPTIRLLYRPGHYDIVYKDTQPMQVYLQNHQTIPQYIEDVHHNTTSDTYAQLFGGSSTSYLSGQDSYNMPYQSTGPYQHHSNYDFTWQPATAYSNMAYHEPIMQSVPPPVAIPHYPQPQYQFQRLPHPTISQSASPRSVTRSPPTASATPTVNEPQIRFSQSMFMGRRHESAPLILSPGNSSAHTNPAHINNKQFQPHIWTPDEEYRG